MACPFFFPQQRRDDLLWPHPARLPLGAGYAGLCRADVQNAVPPADDVLKDYCNLGYAGACPRLPGERASDCARYAIRGDANGRIAIAWVLERDHAPGEHGRAEYDRIAGAFTSTHPDPCLQRQLECYLESYLRRRPPAADEHP